MNTRELEDLVAVRYGPAKYMLAYNVQNGTGYDNVRRADAIAMAITPSRDLRLHGFELKVSRSDFTRELRAPEKALAFTRYVDHWWMVTGPGICAADELPDHWGLLEAAKNGGRLRVVRKAPRLDPEPLTRKMLAGIIRRFSYAAVRRAAYARAS